jgi:hypothetical protein
MTDYESLKQQMLGDDADCEQLQPVADGDQAGKQTRSSATSQILFCIAIVFAGAGGYALWNYQPPDSMNLPKMVGSWMESMKTGKRWEKRIRGYRKFDDPIIEVPEVDYGY